MALIETKPVSEILTDLCGRNVSAEVHLVVSAEASLKRRVRFLSVSGPEMFLDHPGDPAWTERLASQRSVEIYFQLGSTHYAFETRVLRPHCRFPLNERVYVSAMTVAVPLEIEERQRRNSHRITVSGGFDISAIFHAANDGGFASSPSKAVLFRGKIANLSICGMGVIVATKEKVQFDSGQRFFCSFALPGDSRAYRPIVRTCHVRAVRANLGRYMGCAFEEWEGFRFHAERDRIHRFLMTVQRQQLSRRRLP